MGGNADLLSAALASFGIEPCSRKRSHKPELFAPDLRNVISLTVVLADGTVVTTRRRTRKNSTGYDLTHLCMGQALLVSLTVRRCAVFSVSESELWFSCILKLSGWEATVSY